MKHATITARETVLELDYHNPRVLAQQLAEQNLPGRRSMTAIIKLRRQRWARRENMTAAQLVRIMSPAHLVRVPFRPANPDPHRALRRRLEDHLTARYRAEVRRRGGEIVIDNGNDSGYITIADRNPRTGLVLMRAEGWRSYGRQPSRFVSLAYLCGTDDGHPFAVRVAGTRLTVAAALDEITPRFVKNAIRDGLRYKRQGDIYAVEIPGLSGWESDGLGLADLPDSHHWNPATRYMIHRPADGRRHKPLYVPWPARWVRQNTYGMGRTNGGRGNAD